MTPIDCSPPSSSVHWVSQTRILTWVAISFSRGSSRPREPIHLSCVAGRFFITEPPGKPITCLLKLKIVLRFPFCPSWFGFYLLICFAEGHRVTKLDYWLRSSLQSAEPSELFHNKFSYSSFLTHYYIVSSWTSCILSLLTFLLILSFLQHSVFRPLHILICRSHINYATELWVVCPPVEKEKEERQLIFIIFIKTLLSWTRQLFLFHWRQHTHRKAHKHKYTVQWIITKQMPE